MFVKYVNVRFFLEREIFFFLILSFTAEQKIHVMPLHHNEERQTLWKKLAQQQFTVTPLGIVFSKLTHKIMTKQK